MPNTDGTPFRRSSYSVNAHGSCIEVADRDLWIAVRDSKNPTGPVLDVAAGGWSTFAAGIRRTSD